MKKVLLALISFQISLAYSYVGTMSSSGSPIKWMNGVSSKTIYVNPVDTSINDSPTVMTIVNSSLSEWNNISNFNITANQTASSPSNSRNDLYFTSDPQYFGAGVLAVTRVSYSIQSGEVLEADILINESSYVYTNDPTDTRGGDPSGGVYLGDVVTHELGHFIGLAHSTVKDASMIFTVFRGQHSISYDDESGVYSIYGGTTSKGRITGKIVGGSGSNYVEIFGSHIQAISTETGKIITSAVSDTEGNFTLTGLPIGDTYYLYTEPPKTSSLPSYYSSAKKDFCVGGNYRGSFYQTCNNSDKGYPQGISITSSNIVNVGNITIRCNLDSPTSYSTAKNNSTFDLNVKQTNGSYGNAFVGYFSSQDKALGRDDEVEIDLSDYSVTSNDQYLEVKLVSMDLLSPLKVSVDINGDVFPDPTSLNGDGLLIDSDNNPDLNVIARVPLDTVAGNNIFNITITPSANILTGVTSDLIEDDFFPSASLFMDNVSFYFLVASVVRNTGGNYTTLENRVYPTIADNSTCADAANAYTVDGLSIQDDSGEVISSVTNKKSGGFLCGTVDFNNNDKPGSGPMSLALGFMLIVIISYIRNRKFNE